MKIQLSDSDTIDYLDYKGKRYYTISQTDYTGGSTYNDKLDNGISSGVTGHTETFNKACEIQLDMTDSIRHTDGSVYYAVVGGRPPC